MTRRLLVIEVDAEEEACGECPGLHDGAGPHCRVFGTWLSRHFGKPMRLSACVLSEQRAREMGRKESGPC